MHSTRRLLDRRSSAALAISSVVTMAAVASCSSSGGAAPHDGGAFEAGADVDAGASPEDASPPPDAATPFDGSVRPVVCASASCATSLEATFNETFCALLQDGTVACWGANDSGELGRGEDDRTSSATAARVVGLTDIVRIRGTCGVDKSGAAYRWDRGTPVKQGLPPVTDAMFFGGVGCAVADGGILCWGLNVRGQVSPVSPNDDSDAGRPIELPSGAPIRELRVGWATFVLREDGTLVTWGANPPLGRASSFNPDPYPAPSVLSGVSAMDVVAGNACAVAGGVGYCWGDFFDGSRAAPKLLPEPVATPEPIVQIATTQAIIGRPQRWCAVGVSGAVYCWGYNEGGQAGDGTKNNAFVAVKVVGLPDPAVEVKTTREATCALLATGKIYCWGTNLKGQLGNGKMSVPSVVPEEVVLP